MWSIPVNFDGLISKFRLLHGPGKFLFDYCDWLSVGLIIDCTSAYYTNVFSTSSFNSWSFHPNFRYDTNHLPFTMMINMVTQKQAWISRKISNLKIQAMIPPWSWLYTMQFRFMKNSSLVVTLKDRILHLSVHLRWSVNYSRNFEWRNADWCFTTKPSRSFWCFTTKPSRSCWCIFLISNNDLPVLSEISINFLVLYLSDRCPCFDAASNVMIFDLQKTSLENEDI